MEKIFFASFVWRHIETGPGNIVALYRITDVVLVFADDAAVDIEGIGNVVGLAIGNAETFGDGSPAIQNNEIIVFMPFQELNRLPRIRVH